MSSNTTKLLKMELETTNLAPHQVRLIKQINCLLLQVATTRDDGQFFDTSAEIVRLCASMIKLANFAGVKDEHQIPYGDQALEYSLDILNESIINANVVSFDN